MERLAERLVGIDRRLIFLLVALFCLVPLLTGFWMPSIVSPPTQALYDAVQKSPPDTLVILAVEWAAGTIAENGPQTEGLMVHLFRLKRRFAIVSVGDVQAPTLAHGIADRLSAKEFAGTKYGVDWVNWGYKPGFSTWLQALAKGIPAATGGKDWKGASLSQMPIMKDVDTVREDVSLIVNITPSGTLGAWVAFVGQTQNVPVGFACTAVMAPEAYPFLDSGQVVGMLTGMAGAAEYFQMLNRKGFVRPAMTGQAMAHFLILALIALGNVGYFASRRVQRQGLR